jgi:hypothetical protein
MDIKQISEYLDAASLAVSVHEAESRVAGSPGLYSIFVDDAKSLPEPFCTCLRGRGTQLLYVGRAKDSLLERLVRQELRHQKAATFFRGIGAVLGYRPPLGSLRSKRNKNNYRFSIGDTAAISSWVRAHLRVRWIELPLADVLKAEPTVIANLKPLLNTTHNPLRSPELATLREICRRIACEGKAK